MSIVGDAADVRNYFDQDSILSKWGFADNVCYYCGILNSDLNGLLMQCGKCKKAYYCGMKCFNADLPRHQQFCGTKALLCQPKKSDLTIPLPNVTIATDNVYANKPKDDNTISQDTKNTPKKEKKDKKKKKKKNLKDLIPLLGIDDINSDDDEFSEVSVEVKIDTIKTTIHSPAKKSMKKSKIKSNESYADVSESSFKSPKKKKTNKIDATCTDVVSESALKTPKKKKETKLSTPSKEETESSSYDEWEEYDTTIEKRVSIHSVNKNIKQQQSQLGEDSMIFTYGNDSDNQVSQDQSDRHYRINASNRSIPEQEEYEAEAIRLRHITRNVPQTNTSELIHVDLRQTPAPTASIRSHSELEKVDLNETEIQQREYEWETPDWTNTQLRATDVGEYIKTQGDIKDLMLNSSIADIQCKYRTKPEWAQKNRLRKTETGALMKQGVDVLLLRTPAVARTGSKESLIDIVQGSISHLELEGSSSTEIDYNHQRELLKNAIDANQSNSSIQWEKPDWTKDNVLRNTGILKQVRDGVELRGNSSSRYNNLPSVDNRHDHLHMSTPSVFGTKVKRSKSIDDSASASYGLFHSSFSGGGNKSDNGTTTAKQFFENMNVKSPEKRSRGCRRNKSNDI